MTKKQETWSDLPQRLPEESAEQYARRVAAWLAGEDVRSKGDNKDWTGSLPFHLDKEPK